jgi:serine/threonine-protein kinase
MGRFLSRSRTRSVAEPRHVALRIRALRTRPDDVAIRRPFAFFVGRAMNQPHDPALFARANAALDDLIDRDPAAREARLAAFERDEPALAAELRSLLAADAAAGDFLARPAESEVATWVEELAEVEPALAAGARIGAWSVVAPLGAGGMGEVYEVARADGAYEGRAALKLLKRGMDSAELVARFRAERQILARLDHPAIARLYDGGIAPDGRPYLVMELVRGAPITAGAERLPIAERLRRFLVVCDAVEAAHRALVVHRDLKPSNLLVSPEGDVKLLDFGIAKLLDRDADATATRLDHRVLTPAYAAPEQITGGAVTTATDVYALGTVLYELLTGRLPHARRTSSLADLAREVERETVERPSAAAERAASEAGGGAHARRLRGDLDAIVLRALSREPERRYRSAAALADDLRRHLDGRPVEARPDSALYRAGRFARRHRLAVAATAAVAAALVGGLSLALLQADRARREARRADAAALEARAEGERAKRIKEFLLSIFQEASPQQRARDEPLTLSALLDAAERRAADELAGDPVLQAEVWDDLAEARLAAGDFAAGRALIERALAQKRAELGPDHPAVAESLANRAYLALNETRGEAALADVEEAERIVAAAGAGESDLAVVLAQSRAVALHSLGRLEEALAAARRGYELGRRVRGADHRETVMTLSNIASIELRLGRTAAARDAFREVIAAVERGSGPTHVTLFYPLRSLGRAELALGELAAAETAQRRALAIGAAQTGETSWMTGVSRHELGRIALARGDRAAARVELAAALAILRAVAPTRSEIPQIETELAALD